MFGSDILEVAIGMAFLFLFMSTIASALREAFEAFLKQRAVFLERGLIEMLRTKQNESWVESFYKHPLISSLYKGQYGNKKAVLPAYIPKESFSLAILDIVSGASEAGKLLSIADLKTTLQNEAPNDVQRVVLMALSVAGDDLTDVRKHLESWYDGTMDRVTGWYARRSAAFLFVFGFGAAIALNVDAITITERLIVDRPLRQAVVAQAEDYVKRAPPPEQQPATPTNGQKPEPASLGASADKQPMKSFDELRTEFAEIGFPIGLTVDDRWLYPAPQACVRNSTAYTCSAAGWYYAAVWALAFIGWLVTAIAIMLGAPFWFDLLNKLISLRSALKPPEDKPKRKAADVTPDTSGTTIPGQTTQEPVPQPVS